MFKTAGHGQYDKLLEKATSNLLLEPDWGSIMQICDLIRQKDCLPKYALQQIKKKMNHTNPHVAMFGLQVLESVVKNCGSPIHDEVATKSFMEELRELAKTTQHENVKEKIYELVQTWAHAFRKLTTYRAVQDVLNIMKSEGCKFPPLVETDAMFVADTAPEWADGGCCHRCRVEFGIMNRKHHCRACGQIFCSKCSSKLCTLPKFGIEKEVRVCDSCYEKYAKDGVIDDPEELLMRATQPPPKSPQQSAPASKSGKTEEELQDEEQLQLALAISQSEAEAKEREAKSRSHHGGGSTLKNHNNSAFSQDSSDKTSEKSSPIKSSGYNNMEAEDPELAKYLNRTYWEQRQSVTKEEDSKEETGIKSAPEKVSVTSKQTNFSINSNQFSAFMPSAPITENRDRIEPEETDAFVESLRGQIEMFVNRMRSNSSRGRPISYDTSVQSLFMNITTLHSQLLNSIQTQENARTYFEGLQEKLSEVRDARAALDALRQDHADKIRMEAEEAERLRQFQMAQKLQVMRQQKQQYLQCQRQMAMQRMQEQEREMQMRIEQQKIGGAPVPYGAFIPPGMPGYMPNPNMAPGSEMHYMPQMPPGQYMPIPNVGPGGVPVGGQQPGGYPPPGQQGQFIPQQPIPGQLQGMPQQPVAQQQQPPIQVHNPQIPAQGPPQQPNSIPPQVQQQQFYPQSQVPQQGIPNGIPHTVPAQVMPPPPPPPPEEPKIEELISFD